MKYRKLKDLIKLEGNPRTIRDKQFENLCQSIKDNPGYFEARPLILSNRTGELIIIAGNQRYEAAKAVGLKEAPTFLMEGITEDKEKEITIRDNVHQGEWDMDLLSSWDSMPLTAWGLDIQQDKTDTKDNLIKEIISEEEYTEAGKTADEAIDAMAGKIRKIAGENPRKINSALAIIVQNGSGNSVLFLADPNLADIVKELQRYIKTGEDSPLECLMRSLI